MPPKFEIKREVCGKCAKTVYAEEKIEGAGKVWHKGLCFRCHHEGGCSITLDLKNFFAKDGKVYCKNHIPMPKATTVADDVMTEHVRNAPKKASEGLGTAHKGAPGSERKGAGPAVSQSTPASTPVVKTPAPEAEAEVVAEPTPEAVPEPEPVQEPVPEPVPEPEPVYQQEEVPQEPPVEQSYEQPQEPPAEEVPQEEVPQE